MIGSVWVKIKQIKITTYTILSIVNDVSAILVAITIFLAFGGVGSNILAYISLGSVA